MRAHHALAGGEPVEHRPFVLDDVRRPRDGDAKALTELLPFPSQGIADLPRKRPDDPSTLEDWALGLGVDARTIQRAFARETGMTFGQWRQQARLLAGPDHLFQAMRRALGQDNVWSSQAFFEAKVAEQQSRHHRYHDTGYNLEPNVKASPGGLRDIQTIGWVAKRHFGAETLDELVGHGYLTASELRKLRQAQAFLWKAPARALRLRPCFAGPTLRAHGQVIPRSRPLAPTPSYTLPSYRRRIRKRIASCAQCSQ